MVIPSPPLTTVFRNKTRKEERYDNLCSKRKWQKKSKWFLGRQQRLPEYYDGTHNYLKSLGLEEI